MSSYSQPKQDAAPESVQNTAGDWDPVELQKQLDAIEAIGPRLMADVMKLRREHVEIAGNMEASMATMQHYAQLAQQREASLESQLQAAREDSRLAAERLASVTTGSARLNEIDARYHAIQRDIATARGELHSAQEMSAVLAAAGAEAVRVHNELEEVSADRDRLHQIAATSAASSGHEIERLIARNNKLERKHQQLKQQLATMEATYNQGIAELENDRQQLEIENQDIQQTVRRLRDQIAEQIESRNSFEDEMLRLRIERDEWRARSAAMQSKAEMQQQDADNLRMQFEQQIENLRNENQQLQQQLQENQNSQQHVETESTIAGLKASHEAMQAELKQTRKNFDQAALVHAETYTIMQAEAREMGATISTLQLQNDQLREQAQQHQQDYEKANAALDQVEEQLRQDNARTMDIVDQLEANIKKQKSAGNPPASEELASVRQELAEAQQIIQQLQQERDSSELDEVKAELLHAIAQRDNLKDELQIVQRQLEEAKTETRTVEKRLREKMDAFLEEAKTVCARARQMQDQAQSEATRLRKENRELRSAYPGGNAPESVASGDPDGLRLDGEQQAGRPSGLFSGIKRKATNDPRPAWPQ